MANYYSDHPEFDFYLNHPEMKRIVELKERNFADKDQFEDAPVDFDDAIENYKRVLDITGDIAANIIEPNSEDVVLEGPHLVDGRMVYASKTFDNLDATRKAGLWGISMPRRYGGLNMPITPYSMASEIVSTADAGFQNIWSLQDCIELSLHTRKHIINSRELNDSCIKLLALFSVCKTFVVSSLANTY